MMTFAICEDEPYFSEGLNEMVGRYLGRKKLAASVTIFNNGEDLLKSPQIFHVILMDIKLPGQNGMEIAGKLRENGVNSPIIFITSFRDYVFQAFEVDAIHYLLKPIAASGLYPALDKAIKQAEGISRKTLLIPRGGGAQIIYIKDILYCEVFNHLIVIHTLAETYKYTGTLDSLLKRLDHRFFRCHRSYIVNLSFVNDKEPGAAIMSGGDRVLVSRRKQQEFTQRLLEVLSFAGRDAR